MDSLQMWALIVGFFSPLVIAFIQQENWDARIQAVVTFIYCILVGVGTCYFQHLINFTDIVSSILIILVTAIATYKGLWQPTNIAPTIRHATSVKSSR